MREFRIPRGFLPRCTYQTEDAGCPPLSAITLIRIGLAHAVCGVLSSCLQITVYFCVVQYNASAYFSQGNLCFPLASFGLFAAVFYLWTSYLAIRLGNELRILAAPRLSRGLVGRFRKLCVVNICLSGLLLISSNYLVYLLSSWFSFSSSPRTMPFEAVAAVGKGAMVLHAIHSVLALIELILNIVSLLRTPLPPPTTVITYQSHEFLAQMDGFENAAYRNREYVRGTPMGSTHIPAVFLVDRPSSIVSNF